LEVVVVRSVNVPKEAASVAVACVRYYTDQDIDVGRLEEVIREMLGGDGVLSEGYVEYAKAYDRLMKKE
jgi:hypothetical protein